MFSLQRILGHDKKFFELLEASAQEGHASVLALKHLLLHHTAPDLKEFAALRRKDKKITNEITEMLCKTFVTALEREDIEDLAATLYKIPKMVEKFAERLIIVRERVEDVDFSRHVAMLEQATEILVTMVKLLHEMKLKELVEYSTKLRNIEAEGDAYLSELTGQLYSGKEEALKAIILKDLYELLEKALDRCRSAGNVMARVALKHS